MCCFLQLKVSYQDARSSILIPSLYLRKCQRSLMEQSPPGNPVHNTIWRGRERLGLGVEQVSDFK